MSNLIKLYTFNLLYLNKVEFFFNKKRKEILPNQSPAGSGRCHHFQWGVIADLGGGA